MLAEYNMKFNFVAVEWDFRTLFDWISSSEDHGYIGDTNRDYDRERNKECSK